MKPGVGSERMGGPRRTDERTAKMSVGSSPEIDVVRSFLKALESSDLDLALTHCSPDIEYQNMPIPAVRGHKGVRRVIGPFLTKKTSFELRINYVASNGPMVLTERTDAVMIGNMRIPFQVCGTFKVENGQITLWRDTFDYLSIIVDCIVAWPVYQAKKLGMKIAMKKAMKGQ